GTRRLAPALDRDRADPLGLRVGPATLRSLDGGQMARARRSRSGRQGCTGLSGFYAGGSGGLVTRVGRETRGGGGPAGALQRAEPQDCAGVLSALSGRPAECGEPAAVDGGRGTKQSVGNAGATKEPARMTPEEHRDLITLLDRLTEAAEEFRASREAM